MEELSLKGEQKMNKIVEQYAVEVMLRSGVGPIRKDKFSAVREVETSFH